HRIEHSDIVWSSITSQLLELWPVDGVVSSAIWIFRPGGKWIVVRALLVVDFALFCAGIAALTRRAKSPQRTWARWLRRMTLWSAAASIFYLAALRAALDQKAQIFVLDWLSSNTAIRCAMIIPPTALAAWTARLLFLAMRDPDDRRFRVIATFGGVVTLL